jgi:hypothetical protein
MEAVTLASPLPLAAHETVVPTMAGEVQLKAVTAGGGGAASLRYTFSSLRSNLERSAVETTRMRYALPVPWKSAGSTS